MLKEASIYFVTVLFFFQVCNAASLASSPNDEALDLLSQLRQATGDLLTTAFTNYAAMSDRVDAAAEEAKANVEDATLIQCVNDQAIKAINLISSAGVNIATATFVPLYSEETHYISCRGINEDCLNSAINNLKDIINNYLPNTLIKAQVEADGEKIDEQISLIQACGSQVAKNQKFLAPRSAADNGKVALNRLRQVTIDNINLAGQDYVALSIAIDSNTVQMIANATNVQINCIFSHAMPTIDLIRALRLALIKNFLQPLSEAEALLVLCGASDTACINAVITDLENQIDSTPGAINTEVQLDSQSVNVEVSAIKSC